VADSDELIIRLDPADPAFIADPYPTLAAVREATPIFYNERARQWVLTSTPATRRP
jgi:hypothetical protein